MQTYPVSTGSSINSLDTPCAWGWFENSLDTLCARGLYPLCPHGLGFPSLVTLCAWDTLACVRVTFRWATVTIGCGGIKGTFLPPSIITLMFLEAPKPPKAPILSIPQPKLVDTWGIEWARPSPHFHQTSLCSPLNFFINTCYSWRLSS